MGPHGAGSRDCCVNTAQSAITLSKRSDSHRLHRRAARVRKGNKLWIPCRRWWDSCPIKHETLLTVPLRGKKNNSIIWLGIYTQ